MTFNIIKAIIFDLDGVITDSAEYHFLAWKRLVDQHGLPFTREDNEALRGVSRRASLALLLKGLPVTEQQAGEMMAQKNRYYREYLKQITSADLLPGVADLLDQIRAAGVKVAVASASRNSPDVIAQLGIQGKLDTLVHGGMVVRQKPEPDLFLFAAEKVGVLPVECLVVEDAQAGIEAAHSAGMVAVGLGPHQRVGAAEVVLPDLDGVSLADLTYAATYRVAEPIFNPRRQHHKETIFTLGNGYLSTRGTFEERFSGDRQATLVHGIWDDVPISFTELANAPDWTALEIWIDGEHFDMQESAQIKDYARYLDLRTGILHRRVRFLPTGSSSSSRSGALEIVFERFASLADEHLLAQRVQITPLEVPADITVRAVINAHVENQGILHWDHISQHAQTATAELVVRTRHTGKTLAYCQEVTANLDTVHIDGLDCPGCPGIQITAQVPHGETLIIDKFTAIFSSRDQENPRPAAQKLAVQSAQLGYDSLRLDQETAWAAFWEGSDLTIIGDHEAQLALRHALFQLRIAAPLNDERVTMGAKTLSGFGYRGHAFWDNEIFVLPFFTYTQPKIARNMLMYRFHCLPGARRKATANGFRGAQYPWESAQTGDEVTPTWVPHFDDPTKLVRIWTGDIQIHISADIAYAIHQYWQVTGDDDFWQQAGIPVILETAVFWGERAQPEGDHFAIRDVIGPDENHEHIDNNQFTNYMVRWHLTTALEALDWLESHAPDIKEHLTSELELNSDRLAHWANIIDGLISLHDPETGMIEQFEGFFKLKDVDWDIHKGRTRSMQEILGIEGCNQYKALKQADVIALLCLLGGQFDEQTWQSNWDYYLPITDHEYGSSLGPSMHAWAACRMHKPEEAYQHFMRAARADLFDQRGNAADGIHAASAAGLWQAVIFGFAGMQLTEMGPVFHPQFPKHWKQLSFRIFVQGQQHQVTLHNRA